MSGNLLASLFWRNFFKRWYTLHSLFFANYYCIILQLVICRVLDRTSFQGKLNSKTVSVICLGAPIYIIDEIIIIILIIIIIRNNLNHYYSSFQFIIHSDSKNSSSIFFSVIYVVWWCVLFYLLLYIFYLLLLKLFLVEQILFLVFVFIKLSRLLFQYYLKLLQFIVGLTYCNLI